MLTGSRYCSNKNCGKQSIKYCCKTHKGLFCFECHSNFHSKCENTVRIGDYDTVRGAITLLKNRLEIIKNYDEVYEIESYCCGFNEDFQNLSTKVEKFISKAEGSINATDYEKILSEDKLESEGNNLIVELNKSKTYTDFWTTKVTLEFTNYPSKITVCDRCELEAKRSSKAIEENRLEYEKLLEEAKAETEKLNNECFELKDTILKLKEQIVELKK